MIPISIMISVMVIIGCVLKKKKVKVSNDQEMKSLL